ncbi:uncharacterized protein LDX57_002132 [Aspergillus melleus]|uniref:uncharacterized protein n=1 Tax=Aspergillus melleus TaxID=138277 RepID=UPI001E8DBFF4|nr:uncharacterized protein LDX57_002132 [Aspergillus melleus]KAH8424381.1 hypothetical protein LDX57_002132 [Aspergillus melleus]
MALLKLPNELLQAILAELNLERDINAFVQTNRHLYQNFNSFLYRHHVNHFRAVALTWATIRGREETIRKLLLEGADKVIETHNKSNSPLFLSAMCGHLSITNFLVEQNYDPDARNETGRTPLSWAAQNGHMDIVKFLLSKGVDMDSEDEDNQTPLFFTVERGHELIAKLLLEKGARPNLKNAGFQRTPLFYAAERGTLSVVKLLLEKGADLDPTDIHGRTPLSFAAQSGQESVIRFLLDRGADVDAATNRGRTPLSWATMFAHDAAVRLLLERGANPNSANYEGNTPLSWAAERGHISTVEILRGYGAHIDGKGLNGQTALASAAQEEPVSTVRLWLKYGAFVDTQDQYQRTPLFVATLLAREDIVQALLEHGSTAMETPTCAGRTPLSISREYKLGNILKLLADASGTHVEVEETEMTPSVVVSDFQTCCDSCGIEIPTYDYSFNCAQCNDTDYDFCVECSAYGASCGVEGHTLERQNSRATESSN